MRNRRCKRKKKKKKKSINHQTQPQKIFFFFFKSSQKIQEMKRKNLKAGDAKKTQREKRKGKSSHLDGQIRTSKAQNRTNKGGRKGQRERAQTSFLSPETLVNSLSFSLSPSKSFPSLFFSFKKLSIIMQFIYIVRYEISKLAEMVNFIGGDR